MIYTIGYHGLSLHRLLQELAKNDIELLVDVRTYPTSRFVEFKRENLQHRLGSHYVWKGNCLGGYSRKKQPGYNLCLQWLIKEAETKNICVMCMERKPEDCHRDKWIAADLKKFFKVDVEHLRPLKPKRRDRRLF